MNSIFKLAAESEATDVVTATPADGGANADVGKIGTVNELIEAEKAAVDSEVEYDAVRSDIARSLDTAAALEDLAEVVSQIDEIEPVDRALIQTAMNMAAAGTDVDATQIAPGMESFATGALAAESIKDKVKNILSKVKEMISRQAKALKNFLANALKALMTKRARLKSVIEGLKKAGEAKSDKVTFKNGKNVHTSDGKAITSAEEFMRLEQAAFNNLIKAGKAGQDTTAMEKMMAAYISYIAKNGSLDKVIATAFSESQSHINKVGAPLSVQRTVAGSVDKFTMSSGVGPVVAVLKFPHSEPDMLIEEGDISLVEEANTDSVDMNVAPAKALVSGLEAILKLFDAAIGEIKIALARSNSVYDTILDVEHATYIDNGYGYIATKHSQVVGIISDAFGLHMLLNRYLISMTTSVASCAVEFAEKQAAAYK